MSWSDQPWWERVLAIILAPLAITASIAVMIPIFATLGLIALPFYLYHWFRFRIFGIPMPPYRPELPE